MSGCQENDLGTTVTKLDHVEDLDSELDVWEARTEVSDEQTVRFMMAIMRHRNRVAQLGFVPAEGVDMAPGAFEALAERALERLPDLPRGLRARQLVGSRRVGRARQAGRASTISGENNTGRHARA